MQDKEDFVGALLSISETFKTESFQWDLVQSLGVVARFMAQSAVKPTAGRLLTHCREQITCFREKIGLKVCIFKIGVSENPVFRFSSYVEKGCETMWVLATSQSVDQIHMLEAACIQEYAKHVGCRNKAGSGGEGGLNRVGSSPPYYLYVAGGRADKTGWAM